MPAYELRIRPSAQRDLERLSPLTLQRIEAKIRSLLDQPRAVGTEKLTAVDAYRAGAGDHRIVYEIDDRLRAVIIVRVRHRREVYRKPLISWEPAPVT